MSEALLGGAVRRPNNFASPMKRPPTRVGHRCSAEKPHPKFPRSPAAASEAPQSVWPAADEPGCSARGPDPLRALTDSDSSAASTHPRQSAQARANAEPSTPDWSPPPHGSSRRSRLKYKEFAALPAPRVALVLGKAPE